MGSCQLESSLALLFLHFKQAHDHVTLDVVLLELADVEASELPLVADQLGWRHIHDRAVDSGPEPDIEGRQLLLPLWANP